MTHMALNVLPFEKAWFTCYPFNTPLFLYFSPVAKSEQAPFKRKRKNKQSVRPMNKKQNNQTRKKAKEFVRHLVD